MKYYTCPECGHRLRLFANGDNGPADDRWTCEPCGIEYPHTQFPLPKGYVREAKAAEKAQELEWQRQAEQIELEAWNRWARGS